MPIESVYLDRLRALNIAQARTPDIVLDIMLEVNEALQRGEIGSDEVAAITREARRITQELARYLSDRRTMRN